MPSVPSTTVSFRAHSGRAQSARRAPAHVEQAQAAAGEVDREHRHVLADVVPAEPAERRRDRLDLADQVSRGVDQVAAHLQQDQPGHRARGRAGRRSRRDAAPACRGGRSAGGSAGRSVPASISARIARYHGRNRQFSWIISRMPVEMQASIIALSSGRTAAAGFWQRMCTRCRAASSTSSRCESGRVQISTKSSISSFSNMVGGVGVQPRLGDPRRRLPRAAPSPGRRGPRAAPRGSSTRPRDETWRQSHSRSGLLEAEARRFS